jgi:hypothetical protein
VHPVAVIAHGSGSCAAFVEGVLGPALAAVGIRTVAYQDRTGDVEAVTRGLRALADRYGAGLVGGVSLGAHAAVRVAAGRPRLQGLLLLLPAWTGRPGAVAQLSAQAAEQLEADVARHGFPAAVGRVARSGWAGAELALSWPAYGAAGLAAALRATAASRGPSGSELSAVRCPTGIVTVRADPFHPVDVAATWARAVPRARLTVLAAAAPVADRHVLGTAVVAAWQRSATAHASKR